ncbi:hypothetical protein QOT17_006890 [Balamuthia mandrillaris]
MKREEQQVEKRQEKYSLWLCPEASSKVFQLLARTITALGQDIKQRQEPEIAEERPAQREAHEEEELDEEGPLFSGHVTLLGSLYDEKGGKNVIERTKELAQQCAPFQVTMSELGAESLYYRCVMAYTEHSPQLMEAHEKAKAVFHRGEGEKEQQPYSPHISLAYATLRGLPLEDRLEMVSRLQKEGTLTPQSVCFRVGSVQIWKTSGPVRGWYKLEEFPLVGSSDEEQRD